MCTLNSRGFKTIVIFDINAEDRKKIKKIGINLYNVSKGVYRALFNSNASAKDALKTIKATIQTKQFLILNELDFLKKFS